MNPLGHRSPVSELLTSDPDTAAPAFSVVVPCYNEKNAILDTIADLRGILQNCAPYELIIVDDGSSDGTADILAKAVEDDPTLCVLTHPQNRGYGASLKTGLLHASSETIVITDADGTYPNEHIPQFVELSKSADMVVGARTAANVVYPLLRRIPKVFLRAYASWVAGQNIPDINSGMRAFPRSVARRFINILPNGFSFTTTITLAMLTNNYVVHYEPIGYAARVGKSKIRPISDTLKFMRLIVCTGMYFAPLRVLLPAAMVMLGLFSLSACYDMFILRDMTEKTLVLLMLSTNGLLFALLSDMIVKKTGETTNVHEAHQTSRVPTVKVAGTLHSMKTRPEVWAGRSTKAA